MLRQTASFVSVAALLVLESGCAGHLTWRENDALVTSVALVADAIPQDDSPENDGNPEREWTTADGSSAVGDDGGPRRPASRAAARGGF
jgi:hypothetical protein